MVSIRPDLAAEPAASLVHRQSGVGWGTVDGKLYVGSAMAETL